MTAKAKTAEARLKAAHGEESVSRFRTYVRSERWASYTYDGDVRVGTVLPSASVSYYDVPEEYGARGYRYTVGNGRTVLVERGRGRIVEVIDSALRDNDPGRRARVVPILFPMSGTRLASKSQKRKHVATATVEAGGNPDTAAVTRARMPRGSLSSSASLASVRCRHAMTSPPSRMRSPGSSVAS